MANKGYFGGGPSYLRMFGSRATACKDASPSDSVRSIALEL